MAEETRVQRRFRLGLDLECVRRDTLATLRKELMDDLRQSENGQFEAQRDERVYYEERGVQMGLEKAVSRIDKMLKG